MIIRNKEDNYVCSASPDNINRLARLPELYDALMEAARNQCCHCLVDEIVPMNEDLIEECPKHIENCFCRQWWKLLKKVRDGK